MAQKVQVFKVVVLGVDGVGRTSLTLRVSPITCARNQELDSQ